MTGVRMVPVTSLDEARRLLDDVTLDAAEVVVLYPDGYSVVAGDADDVLRAMAVFGDAVVVGARPEMNDAELSGPYRSGIEPLALCGSAAALRKLLGDLLQDGADVDRLAAMADHHDLVLDTGGQLFRVLDGSGSDVVAVAGRLHAGNERPVLAIGDDATRSALEHELAATTGHDLAALLRYDGAAAGDAPMVEVAADIAVMPFWTPDFCALVVRAAEVAGIWRSDPDDPVPGSEVSLFAISPRLVALLDEDLQARLWPHLLGLWPEVAVTSISDAFVIRHEPAPGPAAGLPLHHDIAQISASIRLNAGYDGGALSFPRQAWDTGQLAVGDLVAWPSLVTHPHRAEPVRRGVKYGLTIWLALPSD